MVNHRNVVECVIVLVFGRTRDIAVSSASARPSALGIITQKLDCKKEERINYQYAKFQVSHFIISSFTLQVKMGLNLAHRVSYS